MLEIFNQSVLYDKSKDKIFVVESAIDALSLIKCGADAIALNSTGNAERFIERLQKRPARAILLLALDNDDAGRKPLRTIGMPFLTVFPSWKEILTVIFPLSAIIFVNIVFVDFDAVYGNEKFREEVGRRLFLLYLRPIINGTGFYYIEPQTRNNRRMDIVVTYAGEQHIIELKIWHGEQYNADGEKQLSDCLDYQHLKKGIFKGVLKDIPKNAYFQKNHARLGYRKDKRKIIQFAYFLYCLFSCPAPESMGVSKIQLNKRQKPKLKK